MEAVESYLGVFLDEVFLPAFFLFLVLSTRKCVGRDSSNF